jgi:hypothetical protein
VRSNDHAPIVAFRAYLNKGIRESVSKPSVALVH